VPSVSQAAVLHGTARTVFVETPSGATLSKPVADWEISGPPTSGPAPAVVASQAEVQRRPRCCYFGFRKLLPKNSSATKLAMNSAASNAPVRTTTAESPIRGEPRSSTGRQSLRLKGRNERQNRSAKCSLVRHTEKAAEHCVLRPAGFRIIVQKDRRRSPGIAIIATAAGQRESKDWFRAWNRKAVAKPTHKRQLSGPFVKCEATPLARPDPIGRRQAQYLSNVCDRAPAQDPGSSAMFRRLFRGPRRRSSGLRLRARSVGVWQIECFRSECRPVIPASDRPWTAF
jgi:hypothetical protein